MIRAHILIIISAFILDLVIGDPNWLPHPVRGIGYLITKLENVLRKIVSNERLAGVLLAVILLSLIGGASYAFITLAGMLNPLLGYVISVLLLYTCFATRDLAVHSKKVYRNLKDCDVVAARKSVGMIVGRDTRNLSEEEIVRATVETVGENMVDGIFTPLFYAFIGGVPLAMIFKAISTMDSMIGYKNEKYIKFGWAGAKLDDLFNYPVARLSAIVIPISSLFVGKSFVRSIRTVWRDGQKSPSPNSGIPEAALAGALGVQLGGLNYYFGKASQKPLIGEPVKKLDIVHIIESVRISYISSIIFLMIGVALLW